MIGTSFDGLTTCEKDQRPFSNAEVFSWPRDPEEKDERQIKKHRLLAQILNPPGFSSEVDCTVDDRSLVFATGTNRNGIKALAIIEFDPSKYFPKTHS